MKRTSLILMLLAAIAATMSLDASAAGARVVVLDPVTIHGKHRAQEARVVTLETMVIAGRRAAADPQVAKAAAAASKLAARSDRKTRT
jgi:hypothetical protein